MIDLTTVDEVKCAIETTDTDHDVNLADRVTDVSHRMQTFLDRDLELQSYVEVKNGGCVRIYPFNPPIQSITGIISSVVFDFTQGSTIPITDYLIVNQGWDIDHLWLWPGGRNMIQLTYMGGYLDASNVASTLPKDLRGAATKQVIFEFTNRKFVGQTSIDVADGQIGIPEKAFLDSVMAVMKKYRIPKLG
tara:strand:- start:4331 stop:4903 length:573 start_codon:yes stop_codon:yes gene_type:complete